MEKHALPAHDRPVTIHRRNTCSGRARAPTFTFGSAALVEMRTDIQRAVSHADSVNAGRAGCSRPGSVSVPYDVSQVFHLRFSVTDTALLQMLAVDLQCLVPTTCSKLGS
jgi:hypothetical protein